jgi:hypothetical protein
LYYYLIAGATLFGGGMLYLHVLTFIAHIVSAVCVYYAGRWWFGRGGGAAAAVLFWFNWPLAQTGIAAFQPHAAVLPFTVSLACFAYAGRHRQGSWYLCAFSAAAIATVLYNGLAPILLPFCAYALYDMRARLGQSWSLVARPVMVALGIMLLCYAPVFVHMRAAGLHITDINRPGVAISQNWPLIANSVAEVFGVARTSTVSAYDNVIDWLRPVALLLLLAGLSVVGFTRKNKRYTPLFTQLLLAIAVPVGMALLVRGLSYQPRHFVLLWVPCSLLIAGIAVFYASFGRWGRTAAFVLLWIALASVLQRPSWWDLRSIQRAFAHDELTSSVAAIADSALSLRTAWGERDYLFFRLQLVQPENYGWVDAPYWVTLEDTLSARDGRRISLTVNDDFAAHSGEIGQAGYLPRGRAAVVYAICDYRLLPSSVSFDTCPDYFARTHPEYRAAQRIYDSRTLTVTLFQK